MRGKAVKIYSDTTSNVTRLLTAVVCIISAKASVFTWSQSDAPPGMLIYAWKEAICFRMFIASLIVLVGVILMNRIALLGAFAAMLWILWEFAQWYELSYRGFVNPYVGKEIKQYKLGLWQASWWHALALVLSIVLTLLVAKLLISSFKRQDGSTVASQA